MGKLERNLDRQCRRRAKSEGLKKYRGRTCRKEPSHKGLRYTSDGGCVRCSQIRAQIARSADIDGSRAKSKAFRDANREYMLWQSARQRARKAGREFSISVSDIVIPSVCPVFGCRMEEPSVDRFDNSKGYTPDNIRIISRRANVIKSDSTVTEMEAVLRYMKGEPPVTALNDNVRLALIYAAIAV